eukprot:15074432-Ditylum_brightwellii.AAC.1
MQDYIGEFGTERGAQEILDGKFDPNQFENLPAVNYWIKHNLRRAAADDDITILLRFHSHEMAQVSGCHAGERSGKS